MIHHTQSNLFVQFFQAGSVNNIISDLINGKDRPSVVYQSAEFNVLTDGIEILPVDLVSLASSGHAIQAGDIIRCWNDDESMDLECEILYDARGKIKLKTNIFPLAPFLYYARIMAVVAATGNFVTWSDASDVEWSDGSQVEWSN